MAVAACWWPGLARGRRRTQRRRHLETASTPRRCCPPPYWPPSIGRPRARPWCSSSSVAVLGGLVQPLRPSLRCRLRSRPRPRRWPSWADRTRFGLIDSRRALCDYFDCREVSQAGASTCFVHADIDLPVDSIRPQPRFGPPHNKIMRGRAVLSKKEESRASSARAEGNPSRRFRRSKLLFCRSVGWSQKFEHHLTPWPLRLPWNASSRADFFWLADPIRAHSIDRSCVCVTPS